MLSDVVTLADLVTVLTPSQRGRIVGDPATAVSAVYHDSRDVTPGSLFVAVVGARVDGHDHASAAVAQGAAALVVERDLGLGVPQIVVSDSRAALGVLAAAVYGRPSERLSVVGVTGTNGKTTVTHMIESIAEAAGHQSGVIGTVGVRMAGASLPSQRTTPEASELQRLLARMVDAKVEIVAIEVSSHALALGRVNGLHFAVAAFTNLSRDHLDFHGDMDTYFATKSLLFTPGRAERAVVCVDDEWGRRIADHGAIPVRRVATGPIDGATEIDLVATEVRSSLDGSTFELALGTARHDVAIPLPGRFNVENALVAVGCALDVGISIEDALAGLAGLRPVPGRFESVGSGDPAHVIVDYAHTPEAIESVIEEVRNLSAGRVITVVGAGGDRDRDKRPLMGRAASRGDIVIVTSDNPRSEDPAAIAAAVAAGATEGADVSVELDRRLAIRHALRAASSGDVVLILGKGHEVGQEIDGRVIPFDDRTVVREELTTVADATTGEVV